MRGAAEPRVPRRGGRYTAQLGALADPSPPGDRLLAGAVYARARHLSVAAPSAMLWAAWRWLDGAVSSRVFGALSALGLAGGPLHGGRLHSQHLPFVATPTPVVLVVSAYLAIVYCGLAVAEPRPIKRKAGVLKRAVVAHNAFLIGLSGFTAVQACLCAWRHKYELWGNKFDESEDDMARVVYLFFHSKLYELLDTGIMLLCGKHRQVSFLHIYHHASIMCIWWLISYMAPGGDAWFSCFLNSVVHVFMYLYYLVASITGSEGEKRQRLLWWGRYLTQVQMCQFLAMMAQATCAMVFSPYPKFLSTLLFWYMLTLLALFKRFYSSKHSRAQRASMHRWAGHMPLNAAHPSDKVRHRED